MKKTQILSNIKGIQHGFCDREDSSTLQNPILMNQVHSADVLVIFQKPVEQPSVDALITKEKGLVLTVKTADCAPVLIADTKNKIIAAIHAGWRGAFQGIIENTILKMIEEGADISKMVAAIGPHIQKRSFVADEKMKALFPITEHCFFEPMAKTDSYLFDFDAYVIHRLKRAGITKIESVLDDTYSDKKYLSYRREPKNPKRQYSYIVLE